MTIKIVTIPFDGEKKIFYEEELNNFILKKNIKILTPAFFESGHGKYWTVFIEYDDILLGHEEKTKKDKIPELGGHQKLLLDKLFEIRRTLADKDGIPVFIIASNKQLSDVALKMPKTLDQLKEISGFGGKKIKKYGQQIIGIVNAFDKTDNHKTDTKKDDTKKDKIQSEPKEAPQ
jgi:superfamily II DNA helicase RecQ